MEAAQIRKQNKMNKIFLTIFSVLSALVLAADITLLSPTEGETVQRVPDNQKKIASYTDRKERLAALGSDRKEKKVFFHKKAVWRAAKSVSFKWKVTDGDWSLYKVTVSPNADFSSLCHTFYSDKGDNGKPKTSARTWGLEGNLEAGRKYFWRVTAYDFKNKKTLVSPVGTFNTEDAAPRHIKLEGKTANVRDVGAWKTLDGRRVKQGMLFRGEGLNNNSPDQETCGRNRLTMADQEFMLNVLGIKTDLDLRSLRETAGMKGSPLGKEVKFINIPCPAYRGVFRTEGKKMIKDIFKVFCNKENYPIYFHCIGGVDRTGAVAFILNGLLGVAQSDLEVDWEHSFYPEVPDDMTGKKSNAGRSVAQLVKGMKKYGTDKDSMQKRIELYLKSCGITDEEIATFRNIMLDEVKK